MSKVWMITGASRGLGAEMVRAVLEAGHSVVATARRPQQVEERFTGYGERLLALPLDVTQPAAAKDAAGAAVKKFGRIDVLVNNAGYGQLGWFENTSERQIRDQFETNVFGTMNVTRAVLPVMRKQRAGHVFTVSSIAGFIAFPGSSIYSASKFALEGWMEGMAQELKPLGIAATLIEPGFFRTDFLDASSVEYGEYNIEDYAEQAAQFRAWHDEKNHAQEGDPAKIGGVLLALSAAVNPPVRFGAGSDAADFAMKKTDAWRNEVEQWKTLSKSTDGDAKE